MSSTAPAQATHAPAAAASAATASAPTSAATSVQPNATPAISSANPATAAAPSSAASAAASSSTSADAAAAAAAAPPKKQWKVADVPEGADPLDYVNMEKLKEDNKSLPTTKEGIDAFFNAMPITADVMPDRPDMNREFMGIQSIIDETPLDTRAENFKDSGNEAYKLSIKMSKDYAEGTAKRELMLQEREALGAKAPKLTPQQEKDEAYDANHLLKLKESSGKRLVDAVNYYTQALDVELDPVHTDQGKLKMSRHLKAQILVNRALVHMTMQNYGRTQTDCDEALKLEPKNAKACYRGATACLACNPPKLEKARAYIVQGRIVDEKRKKIDWQFRAEQKSLDDLEAKIVAIETKEREKEEKKKQEAALKAQEERGQSQSLQAALQSRGLKLGPLVFDFARSAYAEQSAEGPGKLPRPMLHPPPPAAYTASSSLRWPVLLLYPDLLQSDFIREVAEEHTLTDHLRTMFPPQSDWAPWDLKKQYHFDNLSVWLDTRGPNVPADSSAAADAAARVLVNPNHTLRAILSNPKLAKKNYIIPGIPTFIILPKQ